MKAHSKCARIFVWVFIVGSGEGKKKIPLMNNNEFAKGETKVFPLNPYVVATRKPARLRMVILATESE